MPIKKAAVADPMAGCFALGDMEQYTAGGGFPEGQYSWDDLTIMLHDGFGEKKGPKRLGVMITMTEQEGEADPATGQAKERKQFYSFGSSADKSFAPHPSGKGIVPIPGGPKTTLQQGTNWTILVRSLIDSGMPETGIFVNNVSVFEGGVYHMQAIDEPAERAGYQSKTAEVQEERKPNKIAVVTEIITAPWEEAEAPKPTVKTTAKPTVKTVAKPAAVVEAETEELDEDALLVAVNGGLASALEKCTKVGMAKTTVKTAAAKAILKQYDEDTMTAATENYLSNDDVLEALLAELGFAVKGPLVKPAE